MSKNLLNLTTIQNNSLKVTKNTKSPYVGFIGHTAVFFHCRSSLTNITSAVCIRGKVIPLKKQKGIRSLHTGNPENGPGLSWIQSFRVYKKTKMMNFVNNTNKQQEKLLCAHILFIIFFICYFLSFKLQPISASFTLLGVLFSVYQLLSFLFQAFKALPLVTRNVLLSVFFFVALYFGFYGYAIFSLFAIYQSLSPKEVSDTTIPAPLGKDAGFFRNFFKDTEILNYHFATEFSMFNPLRFWTFLLMLFHINSFKWKHLPFEHTFFWTEMDCKYAVTLVTFVMVFNLFLVFFIQFTIINHCNPLMGATPGQKLLAVIGFGGAAISGSCALHESYINMGYNPAPLPGRAYYQYANQGFSSDTVDGMKLGGTFKLYYPKATIPLLEGSMELDVEKARTAVEKYQRSLAIEEAKALARARDEVLEELLLERKERDSLKNIEPTTKEEKK